MNKNDIKLLTYNDLYLYSNDINIDDITNDKNPRQFDLSEVIFKCKLQMYK